MQSLLIKLLQKLKSKFAAASPTYFPKELNQNFESFDILWFDIETKVRSLVAELVAPLNTEIIQFKENHQKNIDYIDKQKKRID